MSRISQSEHVFTTYFHIEKTIIICVLLVKQSDFLCCLDHSCPHLQEETLSLVLARQLATNVLH